MSASSSDVSSQDASLSCALATIFRGRLCDTILSGRSSIAFDKGATIYQAGDTSRTFFFIQRGIVKVGTILGDGREIIYDLRKDGDVVGELCVCESTRRDRAVALEATEAIAVPYNEILESLQNNRAVLQHILEVMCQTISAAHDRADLLSARDTFDRLISVLLKLADQLGRPSRDLIEIDAYLTQEEISRMVAVSRERVSRALGRLRELGILQYSRGGHLLLDVKGLRRYRD